MEIKPVKEETIYVFEQTEAQVLMRYNGVLLKEFCTSAGCTDRVIQSAIETAGRIIEEYKIKPEDPVTMEVEYRVRHDRRMKTGKKLYNGEDEYESLERTYKYVSRSIVWTNKEGMLVTPRPMPLDREW